MKLHICFILLCGFCSRVSGDATSGGILPSSTFQSISSSLTEDDNENSSFAAMTATALYKHSHTTVMLPASSTVMPELSSSDLIQLNGESTTLPITDTYFSLSIEPTFSSFHQPSTSLEISSILPSSTALNSTVLPVQSTPVTNTTSLFFPSVSSANSLTSISVPSSLTTVSSSFSLNSSMSSLTPSLSSSLTLSSSLSSIQPTQSLTSQSHQTSSSIPSTQPPTTSPPEHSVKISETNILLAKEKDDIFIELSGASNEDLRGLFLTVRNAKEKDDKVGLLQSVRLVEKLGAQGLLVIDKSHLFNLTNVDFSSVVIALYSDEAQAQKITDKSLLHCFLFSEKFDGIDPKVAEVYKPGTVNKVFGNMSVLDLAESNVSMSLCQGNQRGSGFVLTSESKNQTNQCQLSELLSFKMKLTVHVQKDCPHSPLLDKNLLTKEIVTKVSQRRQCGLSYLNIEDMNQVYRCTENDEVVAVHFNIRSAFSQQIECIKIGFDSFTSDKGTVLLNGSLYSVSNCTNQCFANALPASQSDDDKIKVTVAVVVTCIGIFLVILLAVIVYMKRKKRGLLQFRMTRLDEDDDDLVGDMDDFVGNQGATFSNFR